MNLKKILAAATLFFVAPSAAFASGELWYDAGSHLPQFKKIVVYPIQYSGKFWIEDDAKSEVYQANDYFNKRFIRKLKVKTIALGVLLDENKEIRRDDEKYKPIFDTFTLPVKDMAKKVTETTASNGFIIPTINETRLEPHRSPAKTVTVQMKSYTTEEDGPNGNRTYDVRTWNQSFTIPAADLMLYHFGLLYNMYDREGKKIMTYRNAEHTYGEKYGGVVGAISGLFGGKQTKSLRPDRYQVELFKSVVDEFRKDFEDVQKNFKSNKETDKKRSNKTIGFKGINLPQNAGSDEYSLKSIYFAMKDSAYKYTNLKVDYNGDGSAKYFVSGNISRYIFDRKWREPYVTSYDKLVSTEEVPWVDGQGIQHTKKIKKFITEYTGHHGYWEYFARVTGDFRLTDASGRVIASYSGTETDDKTADAFNHFMKKFYDQVNIALGEKNKK